MSKATDPLEVVRHFTATGFVVHRDRLALHWHAKVKAWLPPGGHINENEDPVQAVKREIKEETGITVELIPKETISFDFNYPTHLTPPFTIMIEDIDDPVQGYHQHIDMIYMCKPIGEEIKLKEGWLWVTKAQISRGDPLTNPEDVKTPPPKDVRILAAHAFKTIDNRDS